VNGVPRARKRCASYAAVLVCCSVSGAARAEFGTEFGVARSDNIDRVEADGRTEEMVTVAVGGEAVSSGAISEGSVNWELGAVDYRSGTYDDEPLAFVDGTARFDLFERRVFWNMRDQLGRQSVDPFVPTTPDTREYVNFFTTGPEFVVPLTNATAFNSAVNLSDVWYENQTIGNTRTGVLVGITFAPKPVRSLGIYTRIDSIKFDEQDLHEDYDRHQVYLQYQTQRRRGELRVAVGETEIRGLGETRDRPMFEGAWTREVSAQSDFALEFRRGFSDAGELFQTSAEGVGTVEDLVTTAEPIEISYVSARWGIDRPRTSGSISYAWSRQEHESAQQAIDREVPVWTADLTRELTPRLRFQLNATSMTDDFTDSDRRDKEKSLGVAFGWRLSGRTVLDFRMARYDRSSNFAGASYEENRVFVTFQYGAELSGIASGL
jgi:hypothetical protein